MRSVCTLVPPYLTYLNGFVMNADVKNKLYFGATALVVLGTAIGGWYFFKDTEPAEVVANQEDSVLGVETEEKEDTLPVQLTIDDGKSEALVFNEEVAQDTTAMSLLEKSAQENNIELEYQQFDFGKFVQKIGETAGDSVHYWGFYVNGAMAEVGADSYVLKADDKVEFKYSDM